MLKILATSAALTMAALVGLATPQAQARVNLDVGVILDSGGYGYQEIYDTRDPRYDHGRGPGYDDPRNPRYDEGRDYRYDDQGYPRYDRRPGGRRPYYDEGLSCKQGRKMVSRQGFHSVEALDCEGRFYRYKARRDGDGRKFIVRINRRGEIIGVERD